MVNMVVTVTVRVCTVMRRHHVRTVTSCPLSTVHSPLSTLLCEELQLQT